jgi:hypothetical protein
MSPIRTFRDLKDFYRRFSELLVYDAAAEEAASYELTVSARRFSRKTQAVVDDKLSFSATLMRAGEVDAANRLLAEFHDDVREEEAALIEKVNEVKVARSLQRERLTRARLARLLAVALVGSSLLGFSAAGMAVAGFLKDRARTAREATALPKAIEKRATRAVANKTKEMRHVRIGKKVLKLRLTEVELKTIQQLASRSSSASVLDKLIELLPQQLAERVHDAMVAAENVVAEVEETADETDELALDLPRVKKKVKKEENNDAEQTPDGTAESEPSPEPSEEPEDGSSGGGGGNDPDDENGDGAEEDPDQLPLPAPIQLR